MAEPGDDIFRLPESVSGLLNPVLSFAFGGEGGNLTLEQLKRRRAVAAALAGQKRGFPKNIGEGIASLGESIGDVLGERGLQRQEALYEKGVAGTRAASGLPGQPAPGPVPAVGARPPVGPVVAPGVTPPVPGPAAARPSPAPPASVGPMAGVNPDTWEPPPGSPGSRDSIARGLQAQQQPPVVAEGGLPPNPTLAGSQAPTTATLEPPASNLGGLPANPLDAGASFSEPEPTPTDIQPMPVRMAQARPAAPAGAPSPVGGPSAPVDAPPRPSVGRTVIPDSYGQPRVKPTLPDPAPVTEYETRGYRMLRGPHGSDPRVAADAEALIKYGQAERAATNARNAEIFKGDLGAWEKEDLALRAAKRAEPGTEADLQLKEEQIAEAREKARARVIYGNMPDYVRTHLDEGKKTAATAVSSLEGLRNAREAMDAGTLFGFGAEAKLLWYRARAAAGDKEADRIVTATETFKTNLGPVAQQAIRAYGGAQISNEDRRFGLQMSGADITQNEKSARRLLDIAERSAQAQIKEHRAQLDVMLKGQPAPLRKIWDVPEPLPPTPLAGAEKPAAPGAAAAGPKDGDTATGPGGARMIRRGGKWEPL